MRIYPRAHGGKTAHMLEKQDPTTVLIIDGFRLPWWRRLASRVRRWFR
ncbi:MAG: hypothetical protein Q4G46_00180 [Propionibacteriaceae bacterium]|nr:hypothetical protein [Propionibacteriaceae bacterium]